MKNSNHYYLLNTDQELLVHLIQELEALGITHLRDLEVKMAELKLYSFEDLLKYISGPNCQTKLAIAIEEVFDRIRLASPKRKTILTSSHEVGNYLANKLAGHKQEEFWALYIDNSNRIVGEKLIAKGTLNKALVHPRDVFRWAILFNVIGIIVAHNHPSDNLIPSPNDLNLTKDLQKAAKMLKIDLLDHFIVGKGYYFSLRENEMF